MDNSRHKQKLYCYIDETGQDDTSSMFVVVAVVSEQEQDRLREALTHIEEESGTGGRKWHKSNATRRRRYLALALERGIGAGEVFYGSYRKPLPYFFPMLDVLEQAIKKKPRIHTSLASSLMALTERRRLN
jgi:hypothetical protein